MSSPHDTQRVELAPSPFKEPPPPRAPGLLARLLRRPQPAEANHSIRRLLARTPPDRTRSGEISDILRSSHLSGKAAHELLVGMWSAALEAFLADDALSDSEVAYLLALRRLLDLGEDDIVEIERRLVHPRFQRAVADVLKDEQIGEAERASLAQLGAKLRLSPALQAGMLTKPATELMQRVFDRAVADRRLSEEEQEMLTTVAKNLGARVQYDEATERAMNRFALLWRIESGELPVVTVPLNLEKGETCHFTADATWHEYRRTTQTVGYASQGFSIRVARGVYYRVGGTRPQRITTEGLTQIDSGTFYLTNKRVLFDGRLKNTTVRLKNIISFEVFTDGLALEKGTGRTPYLRFSGDIELAAVILGRLLAQS